MNPVIIIARNCHAFLRDAIESVLAQDIPVEVIAVDNGSTDGATQLLHTYRSDRVRTVQYSPQIGVAHAWNRGLEIAWAEGAEHALVINADVLLRPDTYRTLLADGGLFVTCVGVRGKEITTAAGVFRAVDNKGEEVFPAAIGSGKRPHPDFSCFLIRREAWDRTGPFDEAFLGGYGEDADYHVRLHRAGIEASCIDLPFYHRGAATISTASVGEAKRISEQAGKNRAYFLKKWGCAIGSTEYYHGIFGHDAPSDIPPMC